jgi:hypothetical protein
VALPLDFDHDGDTDIFVGSRSTSGSYGVPPRHFLYQNDGKGEFQDVAKSRTEDLKLYGMMTDATLADVIPGGDPEIIVTGEWAAPAVFQWTDGKLTRVKSNLDEYPGWWYAVRSADLDGDGDQDLVLGNRGENFYFTGSKEAPAKIWIWDFDKNGTVEKIMTRNIDGRDMPIPLKKDITGQLPMLKKDNLKHVEYAKKSIQDLFPEKLLGEAMMREATCFKSCVAINNGNGQFTLTELPAEVQFSCVNAIWCGDINADNRPDLLLAGNDAGFMPQFSKLDASFGHTLLNNGNGNFERIENRFSGFFVRGDVKAIVPVTVRGQSKLLVTINGKTPQFATLVKPLQ